ncbi:diguanylate cyclase [Desulfosediminicola flagellatus]|uniref:bifunctional diguanylate cyclase/phosphohydrolase n=1 Tax=Desulfosediminicola flagellatus TaxID=2569541 RepID=UPI0010AD9F96|nr:diguanylate cyclase [Desulfosediminicola flagellatus]
MNNSLIIVSDDSAWSEEIRNLLCQTTYDIIVTNPIRLIEQHVIDQVFAIIVANYVPATISLLDYLQLPEHIPALVLNDQQAPPAPLLLSESKRLIDYYGFEPDTSALMTRLAFLKKVSKISQEHFNYQKNHNTLLDWFSSRDGLTGLYNRHHFTKSLQKEYLKAVNNSTELSILYMDIDHFNEINATCGQSFGDFILNEMSARLTSSVKECDTCFRISGGSFVVLMPETDIIDAEKRATEILKSCTEKSYSQSNLQRSVTISIGIASRVSHGPADIDEFMNMGGTALFQAKADGRDRVHIYDTSDTLHTGSLSYDFNYIKATINRILDKTRNSAISSLQLLARDIAGPQHSEHLNRVVRYTELLGDHLGLTPTIIQTLQNSIMLHSTIRYLIHRDLVMKDIEFTEKEQLLMQDFPYKLSEMTDIFDYFAQERSLLMTRSENFDGSGFPEGLQGDEIPMGARILNIVDSFAAMQGERPHRPKLDSETILTELKDQAGKQFDPFLVINFMDIIENNELLDTEKERLSEIRSELKQRHQKSDS